MKQIIKKILVTGGAGFIGSHIVDRLLSYKYEVTVIDNLSTGKLENLNHIQNNKYFHFIKGDILDYDNVKDIVKNQDAIFHEAALTSVPFSVKNPIITNEVNVIGTLNLLKSSLDSDIKRFIFASSASVYGDKNVSPIREDMKLYPKSPYAVSKIAAESYIKLFNELYGLETIILRYFNVYGSRTRKDQGVISKFMNCLFKNENPIIYGDGTQTRDFINVKDIVSANILALSAEKAVGEIINIGTGINISINELVNILQNIMDKKNVSPIYVDPRPGDVKHGYYDISKAQKCLNFYSEINFNRGITELYKWYKKNLRWYGE